MDLRRELVWEKAPVRDFFHATNDKQAVRDRVFATLAAHEFSVQVTLMEKAKARAHVRASPERFFQYGWLYHFRYSLAPHVEQDDELLITTASIGTKKGQGVFTNAVNDVIQQHLPRSQWSTFFCLSASDPCLQVADYCSWAIQRFWEFGDDRSYRLIKDRITYERDLWRHGSTLYY
jgi:hypothetical protein